MDLNEPTDRSSLIRFLRETSRLNLQAAELMEQDRMDEAMLIIAQSLQTIGQAKELVLPKSSSAPEAPTLAEFAAALADALTVPAPRPIPVGWSQEATAVLTWAEFLVRDGKKVGRVVTDIEFFAAHARKLAEVLAAGNPSQIPMDQKNS